MKLTLGFSSCPNDTFIFDALVNQRIDNEGFEFDLQIADVEHLNKLVLHQDIDISKISFATYLKCCKNYILLNSGSALGRGVGPLLISKVKVYPDEVKDLKIAIPGINTTANLLFSVAFPNAQNKIEYLFSDIEDAVLGNEVDAGLIIHENRFTYEKKGLKKIIDLGEFWEEEMDAAIPLGGIVINRNLDKSIQQKINKLIKRSVEYAFENPQDSYLFVKQYAKEMEDAVIRQHINLYVNQHTIDLGETGKKAVETLFHKAIELNLAEKYNSELFLT